MFTYVLNYTIKVLSKHIVFPFETLTATGSRPDLLRWLHLLVEGYWSGDNTEEHDENKNKPK